MRPPARNALNGLLPDLVKAKPWSAGDAHRQTPRQDSRCDAAIAHASSLTHSIVLLTICDAARRKEADLRVPRAGIIRSATLKGFAQTASAVGLDPVTMLCKVGLYPECLTNPDLVIPIGSFFDLLTQSAAASNCLNFGARCATARGIPDLGPVTLLMREAETVESAMKLYSSHVTLHADDFVIFVDRTTDCPMIVAQFLGITPEQSVQALQFAITGLVMQIRWLTGTEFCPEFIAYTYGKPRRFHDALTLFECPVVFNQALSGIGISHRMLGQALVTSPPFLRKLAMRQLGPLLNPPHIGFKARVSRLVRQLLPENTCSSQTVASAFEIDRRTLNRWLEKEGETFSSVVQSVRLDIARHGIEEGGCSLTELSDALGFISLSSFSRWFKTYFGSSALRLRSTGTRFALRSEPGRPAAHRTPAVVPASVHLAGARRAVWEGWSVPRSAGSRATRARLRAPRR